MIKYFLKNLFLLSSLCFYSTPHADESGSHGGYVSPESIEGSTTIDAEELIGLANEEYNLVIIDSRIRSDRRQGYISGSISLPDNETTCTSLNTLSGKYIPTVFYCNGPKCRRSDTAVSIALECGYENLFWFRGGFEEWKEKHYLISK